MDRIDTLFVIKTITHIQIVFFKFMFSRYVPELPFLVEILKQSLGYFYLDNFLFAYLCPNLSITLEYSVLPELTGTTTRLSESCLVGHSDGGSKVESAQDRKHTDHFYLHVTCHDYSWCLDVKICLKLQLYVRQTSLFMVHLSSYLMLQFAAFVGEKVFCLSGHNFICSEL